MRAVKLIPFLASRLPTKPESVGWPAKIVEAARSQTPATSAFGNVLGYPIAYFGDGGKKLFINIAVAQSSHPTDRDTGISFSVQELTTDSMTCKQRLLLQILPCS